MALRFPAIKDKALALSQSRRARRWGIGLLVFLLMVGVLGFLVAPPLIRSEAQKQLSTLLDRPVTIARIGFDPYTLSLSAYRVHIGEPGGAGDFVDIAQLRVRASWFSLLRLHPIVAEVLVDTPQINLVRTAEQSFNFSDLVSKFGKPAPVPAQPAKPLLYAVHNIHVENGRIAFDDRLLNQKHLVEQLHIGIPFIANLPSRVNTFVQPALQAKVDGSVLDIEGQTKPFTKTFDSDVKLKLDALDLPKLLGYAPASLPVKLTKGLLSTDLDLHFAKSGEQSAIEVSGTLDLAQLSLSNRENAPLLDAALIHVNAASVEPLRKVFHLAELRIDQPVVSLNREQDGGINLLELVTERPPAPAPEKAAPKTTTKKGEERKKAEKQAEEAPSRPLDFSLQSLAVNGGTIRWHDAAASTPASLEFDKLHLTANGLSTLAKTPAAYALQTELAQGGSIAVKGGLILVEHQADAEVDLEKVELPQFQPYVASALAATITKGNTGGKLKIKADWTGPGLGLRVEDGDTAIDGLALSGKAPQPTPLLTMEHATLKLREFDLKEHEVQVSSFEAHGLVGYGARGKDGAFNFAQLVKPAPAAKVPAKPAAPGEAEKPWRYSVDSIAMDGAFNMADASTPRPVSLKLSGLSLKVQDLSQDPAKPWKVSFKSGFQKEGTLAVDGTFNVLPAVKAALHVEGHKLDVAAVAPYFENLLNATVASAMAGLKGDLKLANDGGAWKVHYQGDAGMGKVRMLDKVTSDPFAGWQKLVATGIDAGYGGAQGTQAKVAQISFAGFYARIILAAGGRLNLDDFLAKNSGTKSLTRADAGTTTPAAPAAPTPAPAPNPAATPDTTTAAQPATPPLNLSFGKILLSGGEVDYTDNFIKPNFSAHLVAIQGEVGAFGSQATTPAPVNISASLDGNGPVTISGTINPLLKPPFLDLSAGAHDIELSNFAAYSLKYTGYPIVKGKLNVDLHYHVDQGQLNADNHIFIDQFTFGDHVDVPTATNLPVRLAVSLLKNSRGEIDVNLPVTGSLSDPQFSVGGIVWHAVINLIEKAVTSPFALLGAAFGGSEELGYVEFKPGQASISAAESAKLDKLAKALNDRPGISLDLAGRVDPALDTPGLKQESVERQVRAQKLKDVAGKGESIDVDSVTVAPEEYNKYLERAYSAADIKKPRNFIGIAKSLPPEQMKQLMLDSTTVGAPELAALAQQRAIAVQKWFAGKLDPSRIFMVAPKLNADGIADKGATTRVEFVVK